MQILMQYSFIGLVSMKQNVYDCTYVSYFKKVLELWTYLDQRTLKLHGSRPEPPRNVSQTQEPPREEGDDEASSPTAL